MPDLRQVVIERFLAYPDFGGGLLQAHSLELVVLIIKAIIEFSPLGDFLYDKTNRALFVSLKGQQIRSRQMLRVLILELFCILQVFSHTACKYQL